MVEFFIAGMFTALGILIILIKIGIRRVLYWEVVVDLVFTIGIPFMFLGTFSGMMTAIFAGIWVSAGLRTLRWWFKVDDKDVIDAMRAKGWIK